MSAVPVSMPAYMAHLAPVLNDVVAPVAVEIDRTGTYPRAALDALGRAGLLGLISAAEVGGSGEGLGDLVDIDLIRTYLGGEVLGEVQENLSTYLDLLVADGSLVSDGDWYALSERALADGEAQLATAFTDLVRPVLSECNEECWCQTSAAEAEACARARHASDHEPGKAIT